MYYWLEIESGRWTTPSRRRCTHSHSQTRAPAFCSAVPVEGEGEGRNWTSAELRTVPNTWMWMIDRASTIVEIEKAVPPLFANHMWHEPLPPRSRSSCHYLWGSSFCRVECARYDYSTRTPQNIVIAWIEKLSSFSRFVIEKQESVDQDWGLGCAGGLVEISSEEGGVVDL